MSVTWREPQSFSRKWLGIRPVKRRLLLTFLAAVLLPATGCQSLYNGLGVGNYWNETRLRHRNNSASKHAWNSRFEQFVNQPYIADFRKGFRAGYMDVADGGTGCVPIFPPKEYWGWRYQSCEGQARVAAWFAGYPHGARAAEEDGIGGYYQIQTSANVQHQYAEHGKLDPQFQGIYPVPAHAVPNPLMQGNWTKAPKAISLPVGSPSDMSMTYTDLESQ